MSETIGKIMTVTGPIRPNQLGITLMHEHFFIDMTLHYKMPTEATLKRKALEPISLDNLGWIKADITRNKNALVLDCEKTAREEAMKYQEAGGQSIVDVTPFGIGRDPCALKRLSNRTGLNIIAGCGYYVEETHPVDLKLRSIESIAQEIIEDLTIGIGDTRVRAGIIGEIGCSYPWTESEKKVLRAAALAQAETGAAIQVHPGRDETAPVEILEVLEEENADLARVIICHIERTVSRIEDIKDIAEWGCTIAYDMFGYEMYYPYSEFDVPNDATRINQIKQLIDEGYLDQLVISHDIDMKLHLTKYGGYGYGHIINNIIPRMQLKGITEDQIDQLLIGNPTRLLTF